MRGEEIHQDHLYSYVSPEQRVPADHPLRAIRQMANAVLERFLRDWTHSLRPWAGPRFRRRSCCGPCCSRSSIPSAASGC